MAGLGWSEQLQPDHTSLRLALTLEEVEASLPTTTLKPTKYIVTIVYTAA